MTLNELNRNIMRDEVLGKMLPMQIRRTYPRLTLKEGKLYAAFVGFQIKQSQNEVHFFPASYYLKISYPQCTLNTFVKLPGGKNDREGATLQPKRAEDIRKLAELCDEALNRYDAKAENLDDLLAEYNLLLKTILEPEQLAVLDRFGALE
mgnify:CR=1 FL=1